MAESNVVRSLAVARLAIGGAAFAAPGLAGKAFGLDVAGNPQAPYLARLFGVRDAALGIGILTSQGEARRQWVTIGLGCDAADAVAGIAGGRAGYLPKLTTALVTGAALSAIALGAGALRDAG